MKSLNNIIHVTTLHKPNDIRIYYKQCLSLLNYGFNVSILTKKSNQKLDDRINHLTVNVPRNIIGRIYADLIKVPYKIIKSKNRICHFHDPELIPAGLIVKLFRRKVIFDFHELVYHQLNDKVFLQNSFLLKIIRKIYDGFEMMAVKCFDFLVLAEEGYLDYFKVKYPKHLSKVKLVRNYPIYELIKNIKPIENTFNNPLVIYAGGLTEIRGIFELIEAVGILQGKVELLLFGEWDEVSYEKKCKESNGWPYVHFMGFRPIDELYSYMKISSVGVALLYPVVNYLTSMPIKAYEYMACSLPMILSDFPAWKNFFHSYALFANPKSPNEIAGKIEIIVNDKVLSDKFGKNGMKAIEEKYSWEKEQENILQFYIEMVGC